MGLFLVLPATFAALVLIAFLARGLPVVRELWQSGLPPPGELETLEIFARAHGGVLEAPRRFFGPRSLDGAALACRIASRHAWVEIAGNGPFRIKASVEVDHALDLEIRRPTFFRRRHGSARVSAAEVPSEDEQPDVRFDVRRAHDSRGEVRGEFFVHGGEALTAPLARLLYEQGADSVRASDGELGVTLEVPRLLAEHVGDVLRALDEVARAYSRRPAPIALGQLVERYLWLDGNAPRCPYCHVDIAEDEKDLTACERCRTLHHAECFAEHGGCTLLGCGGKGTLAAGA